MKFGGLSESDLEKISEILGGEGIAFEVSKDREVEEYNQESMKNNLRHYSPASISLHMLAIDIADDDFVRMSETARKKLLDFGITDQPPMPEDFVPYTGETIHKELLKGQNRAIAYNLKHQIIFGLALLALFWILKQAFEY